MSLAFAAEALVTLKRIEEFLTKSEKTENEAGLERRSSMVIADTKCKPHRFLRYFLHKFFMFFLNKYFLRFSPCFFDVFSTHIFFAKILAF